MDGEKMRLTRSVGFLFIFTVVTFASGDAVQLKVAGAVGSESSLDGPMVAFVCRLPAMHWTKEEGWTPDGTTGCLKDPDTILEYCRKIYSDLSINFISESTRPTRIRNWCESNRKRCNAHSHSVKPFHCLHNVSAVPSPTSTVQTSTATQDPIHTPSSTTQNPIHTPSPTTQNPTNDQAPTTQNPNRSPSSDDAYVLFIRNFPQLNLSEHEYYSRAKTALHQRHRMKMEKMMEQWAKMNRTAEKNWVSDWKNAEELQKQITSRFQKLFEALTQEEKYEDRQLSELHQQRIQAELNRLKRDALESYMKAIREDPADPAVILKSLKHYIRMEERDSDHTVSRYLHIRRKDHHEAQSVVTYVLEHLNVIERRIRQAFDMLDRVPKHKKAILRQIDPFLRQFETLEENVAIVRGANDDESTVSSDVSTVSDDVSTQSVPDPPEKDQFVELVNATTGGGEAPQEPKEKEETQEMTTAEHEKRFDQEPILDSTEAAEATTVSTATISTSSHGSVMATKARSENAVKKRAEVMHKVKLEHVAFMQKNEHHMNEVDLKHEKSSKDPGTFIATPIGMTLFSIALVLLIAATLILLHRRARGSASASLRVTNRPPRNRFLQGVARKSSAKKADVSNGYENPTYRYLNSSAKD